ncbi:MAG TPA: site-specific DNA-methyltransferase [Bacillota bacterium]|nr:site-specific DNA-methyltransferase [Bacillota bacterium]
MEAEKTGGANGNGNGNGTGKSAEVTVRLDPRKPRLAWLGMDRRELVATVPTQVVEVVRPGRAVDRTVEGGLELAEVARAGARNADGLPPNRLIWTNDNLVALQTLLDERDPKTREYRYRNKVDLVYIDPPFMVNSDFRADNSIDIEIDDDEGVQVKKEPSLVEILAYKDTWRQGLDSFLSMLRRRLELLKDLLAPTGSIYVHLDWHTVHYVKVVMDEVFGYENFQNEIVWKRTSGHSDALRFGPVHDTILYYTNSQQGAWNETYQLYDADYIRQYYRYQDPDGRRWMSGDLGAAGLQGGGYDFEWKGVRRIWRVPLETMARLEKEGRIFYTKNGVPRIKRYLDEAKGLPAQDLWDDVEALRSWHAERLGYPTQKPVALVERIITASCPPSGLVLDCFAGSGTTAEAAERLGRRWVCVDNGKYAVHLTRKRLILLHGQARPPEKVEHDYIECPKCKTIERKAKPLRSPGPFQVSPFTVENMGVYQRAEAWQDFQTQRTKYRDEMVRVFGGEPMDASPLLHGKKNQAWVHVGPLDAAVSKHQVWAVARAAAVTDMKAVTILSADFDTLSASEKDEVVEQTGVHITIRVIPASAIDEVRRRLEYQRADGQAVESMAIPAFYAPLSLVLDVATDGRAVTLVLKRCEVDLDSFIASQQPVLKPVTEGMNPKTAAKALAERERWEARRKNLLDWLQKANSWQRFVDFWAVDWDYGQRTGADGKPIFETDWQSFRVRGGKAGDTELAFKAEFRYDTAGYHRIAARVTDVFGNDGIATVEVTVK